MKKEWFVLISVIFFASCVPHKKLVYFQDASQSAVSEKALNHKDYRIQVDDILYIDVKSTNKEITELFNKTSQMSNAAQMRQESIYFSGYSVDKDGNIDFPYVGKVNVLGYTTDQISDKIVEKLSRFIKDRDDVYVSTRLAGIPYTVIGEVKNTGSMVLYKNQVNLIEALANAGDVLLTGDRTQVEILREENEEMKKYTVDLTKMSVFQSDVYFIRPHDIIYVPALKQKSYGTGATGAQTLTTIISVLSLITTSFLLLKNL